MVVHTVKVIGNTYTHKDTLKATFRLYWKEEVWQGRYRGGSPLLPRLMAYCTRNKLLLEIDGNIQEFEAPQNEADYEADIEGKQIIHKPTGGNGGKPLNLTLPQQKVVNLSPRIEWVDTALEAKGWSKYKGIINNGGPYSEVRPEQEHLIPLIGRLFLKVMKTLLSNAPQGQGNL
jgi:hypothetical protein